ncbi:MAG: thioredoxin-dependent thiol peroxidase [Myroides sp.]|nr:thioredoxin-dependent thiol peroxidase [Myroides sp.]
MTKLKEGDIAPLFTGIDQHGKTVRLEDYRGKKVVLFFYPKASTPGCTTQACNLRDNEAFFLNNNFQVIGVSADTETRQLNFAIKNELNFPLIADVEKDIINKFDIWGLKKFMGKEYEGIHRTTFIIDEKGIIQSIISKVKTKEHTEQIKTASNL